MTDTLIHGLYREGEKIADTKAPHDVPIAQRWEQRKFSAALVNPANRRKLRVIIVGSGLAGGAAAASLGEMGYNVDCFFYQDSARRAHSIAAQGGINAAKNYRNATTPSTVSSTTRSRAATTALARTTFTASPRSAPTSSTSASRRVSPSPVSTAASSTTAPSVACRCPVRSTRVARRVSSC